MSEDEAQINQDFRAALKPAMMEESKSVCESDSRNHHHFSPVKAREAELSERSLEIEEEEKVPVPEKEDKMEPMQLIEIGPAG